MIDPDEVGEVMRSEPSGDSIRVDVGAASAENTPADWIEDAKAAAVFSQTHVRKITHPPAWLRCEFMRQGQRCIKGEGHHKSPEARKAAHEEASL